MDYQHLNKKQPNVAHQWVMWYGDYKYSQVNFYFPPRILLNNRDLAIGNNGGIFYV